jgi:hypothetical protein
MLRPQSARVVPLERAAEKDSRRGSEDGRSGTVRFHQEGTREVNDVVGVPLYTQLSSGGMKKRLEQGLPGAAFIS